MRTVFEKLRLIVGRSNRLSTGLNQFVALIPTLSLTQNQELWKSSALPHLIQNLQSAIDVKKMQLETILNLSLATSDHANTR